MRNDWVLIDAGPLVSLVSTTDKHHVACHAALGRISGRFITTEAVVVEACYMLRRYRVEAPQSCLQLLLDLKVQIAPISPADIPRLRALMTKYQDAPMDYADARLVHLAEQLGTRDIFTLDRRHFLTYRLYDRESFDIVP